MLTRLHPYLASRLGSALTNTAFLNKLHGLIRHGLIKHGLCKQPLLAYFIFILGSFLTLSSTALHADQNKSNEILVNGQPVEISKDSIHLGSYLSYAEDPDSNWQTKDVFSGKYDKHFRPYPKSIVNLNISKSSYWFAFDVASKNEKLFLDIVAPTLDELSFFSENTKGETTQVISGYQFPLRSRDVPHRNFVFRLQDQESETVRYLIRGKSNTPMVLPMRLWKEKDFQRQTMIDSYAMSAFYGIIAVMFFYNLLIFLSVRERSYLYYISFIAIYGLMQHVVDGNAALWISPEDTSFRGLDIVILSALANITSILFCSRFLHTKKNLPRFRILLLTLAGLNILAVVWSLLTGSILINATIYLSFLTIIFLFASGIMAVAENQPGAKFFLLAWTFLLVGATTYLFNLVGVFSSIFLITYSMKIGSVFEVILLSLALADCINKERKTATQRLAEIKDFELQSQLFSHVDITTGMPNRSQLQHRLSSYLEVSEVGFSLILLKLARFKEINNTLGHEHGDNLLGLLALKIDYMLKKSGFNVLPIGSNLRRLPSNVAVIDGITFAIILDNNREDELQDFAIYMRDSTSGTIDLEGVLLDLEVVVGISSNFLANNVKTPQAMIHEAQVGISMASKLEERIGIYSPLLDPYSEGKLSLMGRLRMAIKDNSLELYYQPKVNFKAKEIYGVEALLRWQDEDGKFISPMQFIPLAESTGVIKDLTRWVISEAFGKVSELKEIFPDSRISINLSTSNLREDGFVDYVMQQVVENNIESSDIIFEITENSMIDNAEIAIKKLIALRSCGFNISIDDYGTGYASLSYLKQLPIQEVKIDRAFIKDITSNTVDKTIVKATVEMCHDLGYHVVAEGVEDEPTLAILQLLSCDLIQGYFFSKPLPFESLATFKSAFHTEFDISPNQ